MSEMAQGVEATNNSEISETPEITYTEQAPDNVGEQHSENPAWGEYLNDIPEGYKGIVGDAFRKWDANVTNRFQQLHEQYKPYESYKDIIESGTDPQILQAGAILFHRLQTDPQSFYKELGETFGLSAQEVKEVAEELQQPEDMVVEDPRISQLQEQQEQLRGYLQQQQQIEHQKMVDQQVDQEISTFRQKHPEVSDADMRPIMRIAVMGTQSNPNFTFEQAYGIYTQELNARAQNRSGNNAPRVLGTGGQPGSVQQTKFEDMSEEQRRAVMVQELKNARS